MNTHALDALFFQCGTATLCVELGLVSSVLTHEAASMNVLDPRPHLGLTPTESGMVGLLNLPGPPSALYLGRVLGTFPLRPTDLLPLPQWLRGHLPAVLHPAITLLDEKVVWLLDLDTLNNASSH
ncbi:hypothetical protein DL240_16385 [Lujinxingia litoralis]|uniref:CheW-like domain-containing protein n=1 Tax=Lujinxingia litoralis TaxID=2211119 RepID=A0A328C4E6_9DELT|nr:hypothetical protein [Lujinxingia litoralis]RAL20608.1 hypothetical protein DL240_16385 [Lujinxingia litoralis]